MKYYDSYIVEEVRKMISDKKLYLSKLENKFAFQQVQKEIMTLERGVLPELLYKTSVLHSEFANHCVSCYDSALNHRCNGLLIYQPIDENYTDIPIIGIVNPRANQRYGTFGAMEIYIDNVDGNGAKVKPINLPIL